MKTSDVPLGVFDELPDADAFVATAPTPSDLLLDTFGASRGLVYGYDVLGFQGSWLERPSVTEACRDLAGDLAAVFNKHLPTTMIGN